MVASASACTAGAVAWWASARRNSAMTNELGDEIPEEVAEKARALGCAGEVRYVYIDDDYDGDFPAASIGLTEARRFRSTNYEKHKQELGTVGGTHYVAFGSPSKTPRPPLEQILDHQTPPLPDARIHEETNTYAIDDTPLNFVVEDGFILKLPHNRIKAFCVQLMESQRVAPSCTKWLEIGATLRRIWRAWNRFLGEKARFSRRFANRAGYWGSRGRRFKSCRPDYLRRLVLQVLRKLQQKAPPG